MKQADLIKFNEEELEQIVNDLQVHDLSLEDRMLFVAQKFNNPIVCTTRGDKGAVLLKDGLFYRNKGYVVRVKDTVGAGDSFLASLLSQLMAKNKPQQALDISCAVGAFVASREGANPKISEADISGIMQ
jgi:fructokinase